MRGFRLPLVNRHLGGCVALGSPSQTAISGYAWLWTPPHKPPSRGMQASSGRFAPTSSALTPTRVGFHGMSVASCWRANAFGSQHHDGMHMVECVKAFRSTDGGCAARQHPSAATGGGRRTRQRGVFSTRRVRPSIWRATIKISPKNWNLTPIKSAPFAHLSDQVIGHSQG